MSSKSDSRKRRNYDESHKRSHGHRTRSRSRSPNRSHRKKEKSHHSEKSVGIRVFIGGNWNEVDPTERESAACSLELRRARGCDKNDRSKPGREDEPSLRKVKSEPADKGYRKYEFPERKERERESRSRWDDDDDRREERDRTHGSGRRDRRQEEPQVRIKQERERERNDERRREHRRQVGEENPFRTTDQNAEGENAPPAQKEGPNFGLSGALTEDTNTFRGIVIKYNEPPEARKPKLRWRLYVFKGDQELPTLYIHRQSAYLLGRERLIADLPIDHPSCSKQHAAIQYRLVEYEKEDGTTGKRVRPYIIDLESANGTFLNNKQIEPKRYYEMKEKDVLKFGFSSREYVVLHDKTTAGDVEDEGEL